MGLVTEIRLREATYVDDPHVGPHRPPDDIAALQSSMKIEAKICRMSSLDRSRVISDSITLSPVVLDIAEDLVRVWLWIERRRSPMLD